MQILKTTKSLCPECMSVIDAQIYEEGGVVYLGKTCEKHGRFDDIYWSDYEIFKRAEKYECIGQGFENQKTPVKDGCPFYCGI